MLHAYRVTYSHTYIHTYRVTYSHTYIHIMNGNIMNAQIHMYKHTDKQTDTRTSFLYTAYIYIRMHSCVHVQTYRHTHLSSFYGPSSPPKPLCHVPLCSLFPSRDFPFSLPLFLCCLFLVGKVLRLKTTFLFLENGSLSH